MSQWLKIDYKVRWRVSSSSNIFAVTDPSSSRTVSVTATLLVLNSDVAHATNFTFCVKILGVLLKMQN